MDAQVRPRRSAVALHTSRSRRARDRYGRLGSGGQIGDRVARIRGRRRLAAGLDLRAQRPHIRGERRYGVAAAVRLSRRLGRTALGLPNLQESEGEAAAEGEKRSRNPQEVAAPVEEVAVTVPWKT
ncbi:hypothetical protein ABZ826_10455 [Streptomyces sp. NPDC047515]|uniref:hypothetical protein n=1 Tax=Streptomyces sp. NPDC047515 TaxID=3155380 RepID=UPI0033FB5DE9